MSSKSSKTGSLAASMTENALRWMVSASPPLPESLQHPVKASTPAAVRAAATLIVLFIAISFPTPHPESFLVNARAE